MNPSLSTQFAYRRPVPETCPQGFYVSEAEYWEKYYGAETAYEWNNGILEEKPVSDHLTFQEYVWLFKLLEHYFTVYANGQTIGLEMAFRMRILQKIVIRKPDLGVVCNSNPVALKPLDRSYRGVPDLCIEALSDSSRKERERDTLTKKSEYEAIKVREYYILHHNPAHQAFYYLDNNGVYAPIQAHNGVIRSTVLPDFQFRIDDLQQRPDPQAMLSDPVYQHFILPEWQVDRARIEEMGLRLMAETRARREAEQRVSAEMDAREKAEQRAAAEIDAREKAEQRAVAEADAREKAEQRAVAEMDAREKTEQRIAAAEHARRQAEQQAAAAAAEIARLKALLSVE